jgi:hypothetical protein
MSYKADVIIAFAITVLRASVSSVAKEGLAIIATIEDLGNAQNGLSPREL